MAEQHGADTSDGATRRTVLRGAALVGLAAPLLAGCGSSDDVGDTKDTTSDAPRADDKPPSGSNGGASSGGQAADAVATTGEIPVGSGAIFESAGVVITQPKQGTFHGFSNICTHMGCPLHDVTDTINCICHGSSFSIDDGSVVSSPATQPLPEKAIVVSGSEITLG